MKFLIALLFSYTFSVQAENVPLPTSVMGVDEIVSEFRDVFKSKIVALGKNYITQTSDKVIVYKSTETLNCNGKNTSSGSVISSIKYSANTVGNEMNEKVMYTGCNDDISIVEDVITKGEKLQSLSSSDLLKGKRSIDLKDNETFKLYRISNQENEEIFKVLIEKSSANTKFVSMYYLGQKFFTMYYEFDAGSTRLTLTVYSYSAKYVRKHASWTTGQRPFPPYSISILATKDSNDPVKYIDMSGTRLSLSNFLSMFDEFILAGTVSRLRAILEYHNYYFPETETTKSGAQSQRLLEDLRIAQSRLQTNTEINLVKNLIQDFINAAELGQLIDNRPKEQ